MGFQQDFLEELGSAEIGCHKSSENFPWHWYNAARGK
jgi:hypothetical protein